MSVDADLGVEKAESDLGVEIDEENDSLQLDKHTLRLADIRHIILNKDAAEGDMIAGAMVIQTMPGEANLLSLSTSSNRVELIFEGTNADDAQRKVTALESFSRHLEEFTASYGIGVTNTNITQELFHRTFAEVD